MSRRSKSNRLLTYIWIGAALIVIAGVAIAMTYAPSPPTSIVLAAGAQDGAYYSFARRYAEKLKAEGVDVEVLETAGSLANLELLDAGKADIGFVQSGTHEAAKDPDKLRGIASLYYEPLWIFSTGAEPIDRFEQMRGKRLGIGAPSSGTQAVVEQLLGINRIEDGKDGTTFRELSMTASADALLAGELDIAFFVASPTASAIRRLIEAPETLLVNIRRHRAYARNVLFIKDITIPEGMLDLRRNIPARDIVVLSTLATAVCRADLHPAMVELFSRVASELHSGRQLLEQGGEFPSPDFVEFPIHESAADYFRSGPSFLSRYLPFWLAALIKRLIVLAIPLITLMIPVMRIAPAIYKTIMRRRIYRWYDDLDRIEEVAFAADDDATRAQAVKELEALSKEVEDNIRVPSSFRHDEYDLRMHLKYMRDKFAK